MKDQKMFIGGWVDARLKRLFLKELDHINQKGAAVSTRKISQARFLEMLLTESVTLYRKPGTNRPKAASQL
jgi:hypothetical protein